MKLLSNMFSNENWSWSLCPNANRHPGPLAALNCRSPLLVLMSEPMKVLGMIGPGRSSQARANGNLWMKMDALLPCSSEVCVQLWFSATPERIKLHVGQLSRYCTCCLPPSLPFHPQSSTKVVYPQARPSLCALITTLLCPIAPQLWPICHPVSWMTRCMWDLSLHALSTKDFELYLST